MKVNLLRNSCRDRSDIQHTCDHTKTPDRSMTMIIPFAAGGPTDVLGRVVAGRMSNVLGQQVVVENVTGAGGMTGSARVAKAAADGYQFVLAPSRLAPRPSAL